MVEHNYKFNVTMTCGGCSGAVERVLKKLEGVKSYDVSLDSQTATVKTEENLDYATVLEKIKKIREEGKLRRSGWCRTKCMSWKRWHSDWSSRGHAGSAEL